MKLTSTQHHTRIHVRGYELDSFGHVNHAIYIRYLEHARWELLREAKITLQRLEEWKTWPVIASLEAHYLKPTYLGDELEILTSIRDFRPAQCTFEQEIRCDGRTVFKGSVRVVIVNELGRPSPAHPEFLNALQTWSPITSA